MQKAVNLAAKTKAIAKKPAKSKTAGGRRPVKKSRKAKQPDSDSENEFVPEEMVGLAGTLVSRAKVRRKLKKAVAQPQRELQSSDSDDDMPTQEEADFDASPVVVAAQEASPVVIAAQGALPRSPSPVAAPRSSRPVLDDDDSTPEEPSPVKRPTVTRIESPEASTAQRPVLLDSSDSDVEVVAPDILVARKRSKRPRAERAQPARAAPAPRPALLLDSSSDEDVIVDVVIGAKKPRKRS